MLFYERFVELCEEKGVSQTRAVLEAGGNKGSVTYWKKKYQEGKDAKPDSYMATKLANYFGISVDYLLCRTDDPVDYSADGDALAEIPLVYVEAAGGDMKKARAAMLAAERDAHRERAQKAGLYSRFSARDADLIFALWGDGEDITEEDVDDVRRFAAFLKEKKKK